MIAIDFHARLTAPSIVPQQTLAIQVEHEER
jgi:hypothetical protein